MDTQSKEDWVERTLASLDRSERASAPDGLFEKAWEISKRPAAKIVAMPRGQVRAAAACFALLVAANLLAAATYSTSKNQPRAAAETAVGRAYFDFALTPDF